ncbi:MAG TPA: cytochrome b/b6 domain-containing protein [Gemmatimonadales bacterium]|nr:cytochrome b/b6 domain-containing protein [Gemmatimonadales bacterium]
MTRKDVFFDGVALDAAHRGRGPYIWRFTVGQRVLHGVLVVAFFVLAFTGLPLRFSCVVWAPKLMALWGGARTAGLIHRWAGGVVLACFAGYLGYAAVALARARDRRALLWGPESILLGRRDFREFWQMLRWAVGKGERPRFGRYSYREKFNYLMVFLGLGVIAATGLLLWFPEFFGRFLPGVVFNVATIVHSYQVMLLAALIVAYHFFDVHLRSTKFPLDGVMVTGRATLGYMEEEHPLVAEALGDVAAQAPSARAVADRVAPPAPRWLGVLSAASGMLFLALGVLLIVLGLWDVLC